MVPTVFVTGLFLVFFFFVFFSCLPFVILPSLLSCRAALAAVIAIAIAALNS